MLPVMAIQSWWWWWWSSSSSSWCHITSCCGFWMWASPRFDCARELLLGTDERRPVAPETFGEVLGLLSLSPGRNVSPFTSCHRNFVTGRICRICSPSWSLNLVSRNGDKHVGEKLRMKGLPAISYWDRQPVQHGSTVRCTDWLVTSGLCPVYLADFRWFQMISAFKRSFSNKFSLASIVHILIFHARQLADVTVLQWWFWYVVIVSMKGSWLQSIPIPSESMPATFWAVQGWTDNFGHIRAAVDGFQPLARASCSAGFAAPLGESEIHQAPGDARALMFQLHVGIM